MTEFNADTDVRSLLRQMFDVAVATADPIQCIPAHLPPPPEGRTIVVGAGKAGVRMAGAVEANWPSPLEGLMIVPYGYKSNDGRIEIVEASHPVPDEAGNRAAKRILDLVSSAGPEDIVLCLISGGGSALMSLPAEGLTADEKASLNSALLRCGANISEMNRVRKHLSAIKGGRLAAAAAPAPMVSLLISDVPGDDPAVIASGPTVADPTTCEDAARILEKYAIGEPVAAIDLLKSGQTETLKPGAECFDAHSVKIVATPKMALEAAADLARTGGIEPVILGDAIEGEARDVAKNMAEIATELRRTGKPVRAPAVLLSGGETTVTVTGNGRGGRNCEFLLALALALNGAQGIYALAADTDGIDGIETNAGAFITPDSLVRASNNGMDANAFLADNDSFSFFDQLEDLVVTGPTHTNVNDFRAILVV